MMKTKIQTWLTVLLFVAVSIFICESAQAQFGDLTLPPPPPTPPSTHYGEGGGGGGSNYRPAPEPAWEQNEDAAREINNQGAAYFNKGDYEEALKYYQEAYDTSQYEKYAKVYRHNIAVAKKFIALNAVNQQAVEAWNKQDYREALRLFEEQQKIYDGPNVREDIADTKARVAWSEATTAADYRKAIKMRPNIFTPECIRYVEGLEANEKQQRQDKITVVKMNDIVQHYVQKIDNSTISSGEVPFVDSSVPLKDTVAEKPSDQKVTSDYQGGKKANPGELPPDQNAGQTGNNNASQALNALNDVGASGGGRQQVIDTPGPQGKNITPVSIPTPTSSSEMPDIPKGMEQDKVIQEGLGSLNKWLPQLQQAKADVKKAQASVDQATDATERQMAQNALSFAQGTSQGLQNAVDSAKKIIVERTIYLKPFTISSAASPASTPAQGQSSAPTSASTGSTQKGN